MPYPVAACRNRNFGTPDYVFDTTNLVAYWKLSDATDSYGSNTLTNSGVTFGTGKLGNCGTFDGGDVMSIADNAALSMDTNQSFHIDGWIQHVASGDNHIPVVKGVGGPAADYEYQVRISTSDYLVMDISNGVTDKTFTGSALGALTPDTWYYFAAWHDADNDVVGLQVNGTSATSAWPNGCWNSTYTFYLGSRAGTFPLVGKLDDVAIYKDARDEEYRTNRYNGGNGQELL